jgi:hypothetical protein
MTELANPSDHFVAVRALSAKRADIVFEIAEVERTAGRLRAQLVHIDATLRLFRPGVDLDALPKRKGRHYRSDYFAQGEISKRALEMMRDGREISSTDIADEAMRDKGLDPHNDSKTRTDFQRRIVMQLSHMYRDGVLVKTGLGRSAKWKLAPQEPDLI